VEGTPAPATASLVCDRDFLPAALSLIEEAETAVNVAQFSLYPGSSTGALRDALIDAAERGVTVRVLLDDEVEQNGPAAEALVAGGVDARLDRVDTTMHAKVVAADDAAIVGSTNGSDSAIERNRECNLLLRDGAPPSYVAGWFDRVWADATDRTPPGPRGTGDVVALVNDDLLAHLLDRVGEARRRVDFTMYATYLQPNNLDSPAMQVFSAFEEAAARGVVVRGVAEHSRTNEGLNAQTAEAVEWLRARGVSMRWEDGATVTHAKVIRADDGIQVESANFSTSGFERNQEVGAWTTQEAPVAAFEAWFEDLWGASTEEPAR